jgi:hypothetical protein
MIELQLAGGGTIRLTVECIDAELSDLTGPWEARGRPIHEGGIGVMARRLNASDTNFAADFNALLAIRATRWRKMSPARSKPSSPMSERAAMPRWSNFPTSSTAPLSSLQTLKLTAAEIEAASPR